MKRYIKVEHSSHGIDVTISQYGRNKESKRRRKQKTYQSITGSSANRLEELVLFNATIFPDPEIWAFYGEN